MDVVDQPAGLLTDLDVLALVELQARDDTGEGRPHHRPLELDLVALGVGAGLGQPAPDLEQLAAISAVADRGHAQLELPVEALAAGDLAASLQAGQLLGLLLEPPLRLLALGIAVLLDRQSAEGLKIAELRLLERQLELPVVEADEPLAPAHPLTLLDPDSHDPAGDFETDVRSVARPDAALGAHRQHQVAAHHLGGGDRGGTLLAGLLLPRLRLFRRIFRL